MLKAPPSSSQYNPQKQMVNPQEVQSTSSHLRHHQTCFAYTTTVVMPSAKRSELFKHFTAKELIPTRADVLMHPPSWDCYRCGAVSMHVWLINVLSPRFCGSCPARKRNHPPELLTGTAASSLCLSPHMVSDLFQ